MKKMIMGGMIVGSTIGGFVPYLWTSNVFSFSSVLLTAVGGIAGIYGGLKLARYLGMD
jgi:hypothetical protein